MRPRKARTLLFAFIISVGGAGLSFAVFSLVLIGLLGLSFEDDAVGSAVLAVSFSAVGMLIAVKRPRHAIGWIFLISGFFSGVNAVTAHYPNYSPLPGRELAAWAANWSWAVGTAGLPLLMLLFPNGRLLSRRWRGALWVVLAGVVVAILPGAVTTWPLAMAAGGREVSPPEWAAVWIDRGSMMLGIGLLASIVSIGLRYRRSVGTERQQMKWLFYAGAITLLVLFLFSPAAPIRLSGSWTTLSVLMLPSVPIATAVAVLKYRLYDIDVIVNRTLVYAALTAVLVGAYAGGVLVFRTILDPVTGDNDIAIAASTLAVAALFGPARRRIQSFIDRRFYRARYDARRTLDEFAQGLRDEVELETLATELRTAVEETMRPTYVGLWLVAEERP